MVKPNNGGNSNMKRFDFTSICRCIFSCSTLLLIVAACLPTESRAQSDTIYAQKTFGNKDKGGMSRLERSAMDYMLQYRQWAKSYDEKKFGDHLFLEMGAGLNTTEGGTFRREGTGKIGAQANIAIGDRISPEHNVRLGIGALYTKRADGRAKAINLTLDYLLNFNAIGSSRYDRYAPFEIYGVAGIDVNYGQYHTNNESVVEKAKGLGFHLGMRGQLHLSDYTYLYVEPRVGVLRDVLVSGTESNYGYRPIVSLSAGMGYDLMHRSVRRKVTDTDNWHANFFNRMFISGFAGPQLLVSTAVSNFKDDMGARLGGAFGKWFTPAVGLRFTGSFATNKNKVQNKDMKAVSFAAEMLWNMHQTFGGYNPQRKYWVNAVFGPSLSFVTNDGEAAKVLGFGVGLQPTFRLGNSGFELFLEPRADLYEGDYAKFFGLSHNWKLVASMLAGINITNTELTTRTEVKNRNRSFVHNRFFDNMFVEVAGGLNTTLNGAEVVQGKNLMPAAEIAFGKWFTALSGLRLRAHAGDINLPESSSKSDEPTQISYAGLSLDYLFNLTNATTGYLPERRAEIIGLAGIDFTGRTEKWALSFGVHAGAQGLLHLNKMYALYLEPRAAIYSDNFVPRTSNSRLKKDVLLTLTAGLHVNLKGYESKREQDLYNAGRNPYFITFAGGTGTHGADLKPFQNYGLTARLGFGRWFSAISAWRLTAQGYYFHNLSYDDSSLDYAKAKVGFDYMIDASAFTYGYNPDRFFSVRPLLGVAVGVSHMSDESTLAFDVHTGLQLAMRASNRVEIFGEGLLAFEAHSNNIGQSFSRRLNMFQPSVLVGLNYRMGGDNNTEVVHERPELHRFATLSAGIGFTSDGVNVSNNTFKKPGIDFDLCYGQMFTGLHGLQAGISNYTRKYRGDNTKNYTTLHFDYIFDVRSFITRSNEPTGRFRLAMLAGITANIAKTNGHQATYAMGFEGGLRAGIAVSRRIEIFAQPMGHLMQKTIFEDGSNRSAETFINMNLGVKYNF